MSTQTENPLTKKKCRPCERDAKKFSAAQIEEHLNMLSGWRLGSDGQRIEKQWVVKDFTAGIEFFRQIGKLADEENHHPELHLTGYRHVWIELSTHSIGGLSENDFIMAAKIDALPVTLKDRAL